MLQHGDELDRTAAQLRHSLQRIRISIELLECDVPGLIRWRPSPQCKYCNMEMKWSRSFLAETGREIAHVFICSWCGELSETNTRARVRLEG